MPTDPTRTSEPVPVGDDALDKAESPGEGEIDDAPSGKILTNVTGQPPPPEEPTAESLDFRINDQGSFDAVAGAGHEVAGLYAWCKLDCLIHLARLVSLDFFARPEFYKRVGNSATIEKLAQLHARYGCSEFFLSDEQRQALFTPLFDDAAGDFVRDRDALLSAAATFSEWGQTTGQPMLREAVITTHENFLGQLTLFAGASVRWSRLSALPPLANDVAYDILRDPGVTAVFKVAVPPGEDWPYREDAQGDLLVEAISGELDQERRVERHAFRLQQRAALRGAEAIATAIDFRPDAGDGALDRLITRCYTWYAALQGVTGMGRVVGGMSYGNGNGDRRVAGAGSFLHEYRHPAG